MPRRLALPALLLALMLPGTAQAAAGWTSPPRTVAASGVVSRPAVGLNTGGFGTYALYADATGARMTGNLSFGGVNVEPVGMYVGNQGFTTAAWLQDTATDGRQLYVVQTGPDGALTAPFRLSTGAGSVKQVSYAHDFGGAAALTWVQPVSGLDQVFVSSTASSIGDTFSTPFPLSAPSTVDNDTASPTVGVISSGVVSVAYLKGNGVAGAGNANSVYARQQNFSGGTWGAETQVSDPGATGPPVSGKSSDFTVAWPRGLQLEISTSASNAAFGTKQILTGNSPLELFMTNNNQGDFVLAWTDMDSGTRKLKVAARPFNLAGDLFTQVDGPVSPGAASRPTASVNDFGISVIGYVKGDQVAAVRRPGRTLPWGAETVLSNAPAADEGPSTQIVNVGESSMVGWRTAAGAVVLSGWDKDPPKYVDTRFGKDTVELGKNYNRCVTAVDDWGPVTESWNMADGTTLSGACVNHVYKAAGTYDVQVTATDSVGNSVIGIFTVTVTTPVATVTPPVTTPPATAPPTITINKVAKRPNSFSGTAAYPKGVAKVGLGVAGFKGGAKPAIVAAKRCTQLTAASGAFKTVKLTKGFCAPIKFLTAKGTTSWKLTLKRRLKKGTYVLFVRATGAGGGPTTTVRRLITVR
jgi:hypothetical protein